MLSAPSPPSQLSSLLERVRPSGISNLHELAIRLKAEGREILDLTTGEPDFDTPEHIREAAVKAIRHGDTRYTPVDGTLTLKTAIRDKFLRDNTIDYSEDDIVVTAGAKPLLAVAMRVALNPQDEAVLASPCWPSHPAMVSLAGGIPVPIATNAETGFKLAPQALAAALSARTRLLVLCSPSNPTGATYSRAELEALAEVLRTRPDIRIICDDIYEQIRFDDRDFATIAQLGDDLRARTLTVNGVSKAYAMTGWRIGYGAGPPDWVQGIRQILTQTSGGPCSVSQAAAHAALEGPQAFLADWAGRYRQRRDLAVSRLKTIPRVRVHVPEGAFYLLPDIGKLFGQRTAEGRVLENSEQVAAHFLDHGVIVIPGSVFNAEGYIRMSIAVCEADLERACDRIQAACRDLN